MRTEYIVENGIEYRVTTNLFGSKAWYQNGKRHRLDGPAIERADGYKFWYQNGKYHRLDGPAIERANGIIKPFK